jgi:FkbM family methyltransferase
MLIQKSLRLSDHAQERKIVLRDGTSDLAVYDDIFGKRQYDFVARINAAYRGRSQERTNELFAFIQQRSTEGKRPLVIDGGANIGLASVFLADYLPNAIVIAIEPELENFKLLQTNSAGLDIQPVHGAISATRGRARLSDPGEGHWGYRTEAVDSNAAESVPKFTVNDIYQQCATMAFPFLVKIDIEGGEKDLFSANTEWVARTPLIIIELHDWLLSKQGVARPFLQCVAQSNRDFLQFGEDIYSIAHDLADCSRGSL